MRSEGDPHTSPGLGGPAVQSLTLLVLSGDMEKGAAACTLALAALASGYRVELFFSFWGLNLLKQPGAGGGGSLQRLMGVLNRDHAGRQRLGRLNLLGVGRWAMVRLMKSRGLPSFREALTTAHRLGARVVACSNTLELLGLTRDALVPEVDEVAGAAAFLESARGGQVITLS